MLPWAPEWDLPDAFTLYHGSKLIVHHMIDSFIVYHLCFLRRAFSRIPCPLGHYSSCTRIRLGVKLLSSRHRSFKRIPGSFVTQTLRATNHILLSPFRPSSPSKSPRGEFFLLSLVRLSLPLSPARVDHLAEPCLETALAIEENAHGLGRLQLALFTQHRMYTYMSTQTRGDRTTRREQHFTRMAWGGATQGMVNTRTHGTHLSDNDCATRWRGHQGYARPGRRDGKRRFMV